MTFYQLGFLLMTGAAISMAFLVRALARRNQRTYDLLRQYREYYSTLLGSDAVIFQHRGDPDYIIAVCRYYEGRRFDIKRFAYNPNDLDDYRYKYMLAEELRDKYNEEP